MQFNFFLPDWLIWSIIFAFVVVLYLYYETTYTHYIVRYQFPGGIEENHTASLKGKNLIWSRKGRHYESEVMHKSRYSKHRGVSYDAYIVHWNNEKQTSVVVDPTYPDPYDNQLHLSTQDAISSEIKESNMIRQLAAAMHSLSLMDRVIMLLLGVFMGFPLWMWVLGYFSSGGGGG